MQIRFLLLGLAFIASSVTSAIHETQAAKPASALRGMTIVPRGDTLTVMIDADGEPPPPQVQMLAGENQLILDFPGLRNPVRSQKPLIAHALLAGVRSLEIPLPADASGTRPRLVARFVLDLKKPVDYRVDVDARRLRIELSPKLAASPLATTAPAAEGQPKPRATGGSPDADVTDPAVFFDAAQTSANPYALGPEDVIEIHVFELDQLNRTLRVSADGNIDLPLIGAVNVLGKTSNDVAAAVAERLKNRFVQNPQVSVFIKEFNSKNVSVLGAVTRPATYPLSGRRNLLQVLAEAGGLTPSASRQLYIFRPSSDGKSVRLVVPLDELLVKGEPRWNVWLLPGDVVSVPAEPSVSVSVLGAVRSPGIHSIPAADGATLARAIARAGGLGDRASQSGVTIKRRDASGRETILKVDLGDILSGKKPDVLLQDGDVIVVKESFF